MNSFSWKKIIPHVIAISVFLIVALVYCSPALEGKVLQQTDIVHWKGMAQDAFNYKEVHGHFPLWNTHLFSGMPNYQVTMDTKTLLPDFGSMLQLYLPKPASYFFLACLCFYILGMAYSVNVLAAVLGALGYAYATYDPIIISVGHETKMLAIAYMPGLLAGLVLIFKKRYVLGLAVAALFATLEIGAGHPQVTYYFLITLGIMTIGYVISWVMSGEIRHMIISLSLALLAGLIGVGNTSQSLLTTYEYSKYTMRGGKTVDLSEDGKLTQTKTQGLDESYAFQYSLGVGETFVLAMPGAFGGGSSEHLDADSKVVGNLVKNNVPEAQASQLATSLPRYWGGVAPFTAGPPYSGALICLLAVIGFVALGIGETATSSGNVTRWWIAIATAITLFISWGSHFSAFNQFLFDHMPLFNKFRAPSMALIIPQLLLALLAVLAVDRLLYSAAARTHLQQHFKKILYAGGGVIVLAVLVYLFNDYRGSYDAQILDNLTQQAGADLARAVLDGMIADRKAMFGAGIFHILWIWVVIMGAFYLFMKDRVKPSVILGVFIVINTVDLLIVANKYLNKENYQDASSYQAGNFAPTPADQQILLDKDPHYRVLNLSTGDPFNDAITSYYHRSVGGYHAAKLRMYQDIIENQFAKPGAGLNMALLNMLDTRYFITRSQDQQQPVPVVQRNPDALGAAWFVKHLSYVNGPIESIKSLDNLNPKDTAVLDNSFKAAAGAQPVFDSAATIKLVAYENDAIKYTTSAKSNQFAVLSEVYYPEGWKAYIDGKETAYANVNYILRGIAVPAGDHTIEFKFEPASYYTGQTLVYIANILLWLTIAGSIFMLWKQNRPAKA
ncbi:YfhO family protein [Chitinophaga rhizophila]|uniref:YfhO family protein n=1 Tax=Chitinophaga rhizophila TaxID=2866212 RepID=A0ABS7GA62_9BACT|nr:YfhO family protein [Chitinophaga rhizophila]MBW8684548.1 YfhO family protein [Chitinophaga rhizophila]